MRKPQPRKSRAAKQVPQEQVNQATPPAPGLDPRLFSDPAPLITRVALSDQGDNCRLTFFEEVGGAVWSRGAQAMSRDVVVQLAKMIIDRYTQPQQPQQPQQ